MQRFVKNSPFEIDHMKDEYVAVKVHDSQVNTLTKTLAEFKVTKFAQIKQTLEDLFMTFYKEDKNFGGQL